MPYALGILLGTVVLLIAHFFLDDGLFLPDWVNSLLGSIAFILMLAVGLPLIALFLFILTVHGCIGFLLSDYTKT